MTHGYKENIMVLIFALAMPIVGIVAGQSGRFLHVGASFGVAAIFVTKAASRLRCRWSDVLHTVTALGLFILSKTVSTNLAWQLIFEGAVLSVAVSFAVTGLTFKTIAANQK